MARVHARRRGTSRSRAPAREAAPAWMGADETKIKEVVAQLARDGKGGAYIGLVLRDQYAVPNVRVATGKSMNQLLEEVGQKGSLPEDLRNLMKRAVHLKEHLRTNTRDTHNRRGLELMEARIRRLARYYREQGTLPAEWRYTAATARLVVD